MTKTRPDPDSEYLSKYLVDFNKRELEKFFHPQKFPKVVLSVAALGIVAFFFVAWMFPLKDQLLETQFQKDPASASQEVQNINISGPQSVKVGDEFIVLVTVRSDLVSAKSLILDLKYPDQYLKLYSAKPLEAMNSQSKLLKSTTDQIIMEYTFPASFQTSGVQQEILALTFKAMMSGTAEISLAEETVLKDNTSQPIQVLKNNYSLTITD